MAELERSLAGYAASKAELKRKNDDCHAMDNDLQDRIVQLDEERVSTRPTLLSRRSLRYSHTLFLHT